MHSTKVLGFSVVRTIVVVLIVLGVLGALGTAGFFVLKNQKVGEAKTFSDSLVKSISDGDAADAFSTFDSSLKTDESTAYYSWLFWSSGIKNSNTTIETPALSAEYKDLSVGNLFSIGSVIEVTYSTSGSSKVLLTVVQKDDGWKVLDYAAI